MKSKRRHELQHNVLDAELAKTVDFFKKHGTKLTWGVLIAATVVMAILYYHTRRTRQLDSIQARYAELKIRQSIGNLEEPDQLLSGFKTISQQQKIPYLAALACADVGDIYASRAAAATNPADRNMLIEQAKMNYNRTIDLFGNQVLPVAKAHLGLGKLAEMRGDLQTAEREYQTIIDTSALAGQPIVLVAKESLEAIVTLKDQSPVRLATTAPTATTSRPVTEQE